MSSSAYRRELTIDGARSSETFRELSFKNSRVRIDSFSLDTSLLKYLEDHRLQGKVVIPGAWYLEAVSQARRAAGESGGAMRNIQFHKPVVLSGEPVTMTLWREPVRPQVVRYIFTEASLAAPEGKEMVSASLDLHSEIDLQPFQPFGEFFGDAWQKQCDQALAPAEFYQRLEQSGNEYGPHFQCLAGVWRKGREVLGRLRIGKDSSHENGYSLTLFIDGMAQLLASFFLDEQRAFILKGIESLSKIPEKLPDQVWVHGRLRSRPGGDPSARCGEVEIIDDGGLPLLRMDGVQLTRLEAALPPAGPAPTRVVVTSTFTAEPLRESLAFWSRHLDWKLDVHFTPYNQWFQELLNPNSRSRSNKDGFNVILLNIADWAGQRRRIQRPAKEVRLEARAGEQIHRLPNGLEVVHLNSYETEHNYQEIFAERSYLRHGIHLPPQATVIDIGANIGLFSLFVHYSCSNASIYAFEPNPAAFRALQANVASHGAPCRVFNTGVSDRAGSALFTVYENSSVFSTFHPAIDEDREAIEAIVRNVVRTNLNGNGSLTERDGAVNKWMAGRLKQHTFECALTSVTQIIRDNNLRHIDLLKIDAEKSEFAILNGIEPSLWPLIDQVVIEVHDRAGDTLRAIVELLTRNGFRCTTEEEKLLAGSGLVNVYALRPNRPSQKDAASNDKVQASRAARTQANEFVRALESFALESNTETILCVCPGGETGALGTEPVSDLDEIEQLLLEQVRDIPGVHAITSRQIEERYPNARILDPHANELGHVPFTEEGFAAIGTSLMRTFAGLRRLPYKVIVLDCDETLWKGTCGEDGPQGVWVSPAHAGFQKFMARQRAEGMLLCLCSKNNEAEVWSVFDHQRSTMPLKREDFVAWRINWRSKAENLRLLAEELKIGLDCFIFLDDSPIECGEVRALCPAVLTLQVPTDISQRARFLDHVWAFDKSSVTDEDRWRARGVVEDSQRKQLWRKAPTLRDFISGLDLRVEVFNPKVGQIRRLSQLTLRTNQFNFTAIRRSEADVLQFLQTSGNHCLAASVRDRFGDYGTVGLLFYTVGEQEIEVDTFLLSCRVLGRGVEHQILAQFAQHALRFQRNQIRFSIRVTERNEPAWQFMASLGVEPVSRTEDGAVFVVATQDLCQLRYDPERIQDPKSGANLMPASHGETQVRARNIVGPDVSAEKMQSIADQWHDLAFLCQAIHESESRDRTDTSAEGDGLPDDLAGRVLRIWRRCLGNARLGLDDNFIDGGGTSLKAVQVAASLRRELGLILSIVDIFERPTVRMLCQKFEATTPELPKAADALSRGARRRQRLQSRSA